ncbi:MAG: hypothetical protein PHQ86_00285 [Dehalococcoidales bacterium]|nr:hypothetical protein [Dehalococcoidales bacterium]
MNILKYVYNLPKYLVKRIISMWKGIFFVILAMVFGYIFPIFQKWGAGIPITEAETRGFFIVVGVIVGICIFVRKLEKNEKRKVIQS